MTTKPNITPCITIDIPFLALDILIEALMDHINSWDNSGVPDYDPDLKMRMTLLNLLKAYRLDHQLNTEANERL